MHLYISVSNFVCCLSLTHTHSGCASLIWHDKYIINRHLQLMPFKLESFSCEMTCILVTIYCECARGCDVPACAAGNNRIGSESARRETDRPVTDPGRSCEKSADSDHWPVNQCISKTKVLPLLNLTHTHTLSHTHRSREAAHRHSGTNCLALPHNIINKVA